MRQRRRRKKERIRVLGVVVVAIAVLASFYLLFTKITKYRMLEERCREIESSPDLLFPCKCEPLLKDLGNGSDVLYRKTQPMCVCTCEVDNRTVTIEVRVA